MQGSIKKYIKYIVVAIILLLVVALLSLSKRIVDKGISREILRSENSKIEDNDTKDSGDVQEKEFEYDGSTDRWQKVSVLFDSSNLEDRQKEYLGSDYSKYENALKEIERSYSLVFSSIDTPPSDLDYSNCVLYEKSGINLFSSDFVNGSDIVYLRTIPVIIGMYGNSCVVFKVMDSENLIVVDYSNALLDTEKADLFDFGQNKNLMISPKYSKLIEREGYSLLYTKEF